MKELSESKPEKKSLVFFTHAPQGTLGDPSAASKLIKKLKSKYGDAVDVTIVLLLDKKNNEMVGNIFKDMDITILQMPTLDINFQGKDTKGREQKLDNILHNADGIIFFPTFHHFSETDIQRVNKFHKPSFIVTEYDLHPANREIQLKKLGDFKSRCMEIYTGLAPNHLGIFGSEETNTSNNPIALSQISDKSDVAVRDLLLGKGDSQSYHKTHQLFFGYFNKLNMELKKHKVNPLMFIESCLSLVSKGTTTVDFVLPLTLNNEHPTEENNFKSIEELLKYFNEHPELMKGYKFEYWNKNSNGTMECLKTGGKGTKLIRFINGYPFTPNTMDKLMKASDEFVLITGDQSLSEAISNEKIFLYHTMSWKKELWVSLINTVNECLPPNSKLYQFLKMQDTDSVVTPQELKQYLHGNKSALIADVKILRKHIFENKNLYNNLPEKLVTYMRNPALYLKDCLENPEKLSYEQIKGIIQVHPHKIYVIFSLLDKHEKYKLGKAEFHKSLIKDQSAYEPKVFANILNQLTAAQRNPSTFRQWLPNILITTAGLAGLTGGAFAGYFIAGGVLAGIGGAVGAFFGGPVGLILMGAVCGAVGLALALTIGFAVKAGVYMWNTMNATKEQSDSPPKATGNTTINTLRETPTQNPEKDQRNFGRLFDISTPDASDSEEHDKHEQPRP
jgi:hypothetical protein